MRWISMHIRHEDHKLKASAPRALTQVSLTNTKNGHVLSGGKPHMQAKSGHVHSRKGPVTRMTSSCKMFLFNYLIRALGNAKFLARTDHADSPIKHSTQ
eukprot:896978-Pelagomonas_calceolata.AAC.3